MVVEFILTTYTFGLLSAYPFLFKCRQYGLLDPFSAVRIDRMSNVGKHSAATV
jgi:hypothetical protein